MFGLRTWKVVVFSILCVTGAAGAWVLYFAVPADIYVRDTSNDVLAMPLSLIGDKSIVDISQDLQPRSLVNKESLALTYDLHGACLLSGPASMVSLVARDAKTYSVSLSQYGMNCSDGEQVTMIPLSDFGIDQPLENIQSFHIQVWNPIAYNIEIKNIGTHDVASFTSSLQDAKSLLVAKLTRQKKSLTLSRIPPKTQELSKKELQQKVALAPVVQVAPIVQPAVPPQVTASSSSTVLTPPAAADVYAGEYWNTPGESSRPPIPESKPQLTRNDPEINFVWDDGSPDPVINTDHFVARWTRSASFDAATYHFTISADDGVRFYIDNNLIINEWSDKRLNEYTADIALAAGLHTIKIEYFEDAGGAVMKFAFTKSTGGNPSIPLPPPPPVALPLPPPPPPPLVTSPVVSPLPAVPPPVLASGVSSWLIRSVSSMKESKDKICEQDSQAFINAWVDKAVALGANYIAVETPYDSPACGNSLAYTKMWVDAIHARGLNVWHRHMPLAFEGIYGTAKNESIDYIQFISAYIKANPTLFKAGDIFTPIPEPQNGGISGITSCSQGICMFANAARFNMWLRDAIATSENSFASIGLGGKMKIGYYGFDGFIAWGDNNPDWHGILEDATINAMGNITIDHYPEIVGDTMENDLNELQSKYPNTPIVIGEWGTITGGNVLSQIQNSMSAARRKNVMGFNYWHMGIGGNESLINSDMTSKVGFDAVKAFFTQ